MQIDTHFNDFIDDVIDNDHNGKILEKVLDPRQELQKILHYCSKKLKKQRFDNVQRLIFVKVGIPKDGSGKIRNRNFNLK